MQLGLVSGDLMLTARLQGVAQKLGWTLSTAATPALAATWNQADIVAVVIDLRTVGLGVGPFVETWRASGGTAPVVACGPHVQTSLLDAARDAGCEAVVTRGQIDSDAERILTAVTSAA